jgi:hypothetical protein
MIYLWLVAVVMAAVWFWTEHLDRTEQRKFPTQRKAWRVVKDLYDWQEDGL